VCRSVSQDRLHQCTGLLLDSPTQVRCAVPARPQVTSHRHSAFATKLTILVVLSNQPQGGFDLPVMVQVGGQVATANKLSYLGNCAFRFSLCCLRSASVVVVLRSQNPDILAEKVQRAWQHLRNWRWQRRADHNAARSGPFASLDCASRNMPHVLCLFCAGPTERVCFNGTGLSAGAIVEYGLTASPGESQSCRTQPIAFSNELTHGAVV
jgi:hypothetical protein